MNKYITNTIEIKDGTALSKAKNDITMFLAEEKYIELPLTRFKNKIEKLITSDYRIVRLLQPVKKDDIVCLQYPTSLGPWFEKKFIEGVHKRGAKLIILIHDLDSLRFENSPQVIEEEISVIEMADCVISDNEHMSQLFIKHGVDKPIINLGIFDYFHSNEINEKKYSRTFINFAGNLNKSNFIFQLSGKTKLTINTFGMWDNKKKLPSYIKYNGLVNSEELTNFLNVGYGLVWDGTSAHEVKGTYGEYMRINNPHKTSLYLSSGMPVIIWKNAALADFVLTNDVGITINSLDEIEGKLNEVSVEDYDKMAKNAKRISMKLRNGFFVKSAMKSAEKMLRNN